MLSTGEVIASEDAPTLTTAAQDAVQAQERYQQYVRSRLEMMRSARLPPGMVIRYEGDKIVV